MPRFVSCDLAELTDVDLDTVDALARLQLACGRCGCRLVLQRPSRGLVDLLDLVGLATCFELVEAGGEPEEREEALSVEKEGDRPDPIA